MEGGDFIDNFDLDSPDALLGDIVNPSWVFMGSDPVPNTQDLHLPSTPQTPSAPQTPSSSQLQLHYQASGGGNLPMLQYPVTQESPQNALVKVEQAASPWMSQRFFENSSVGQPMLAIPTTSQLPHQENRMDLNRYYVNDETSQSVATSSNETANLAQPLMFLTLHHWPGQLNFNVSIPQSDAPILTGRKQKWFFSSELNCLYVARNVVFPVRVKMDQYPPGATLMVMPVYTEFNKRISPVQRCPNCSFTDVNEAAREHVIQVESPRAYYFIDNYRTMAQLPLGTPAPGETSLQILLKSCCNTSCIGGPNRRLFSILITLIHEHKEIGRQAIPVKCCEGPSRDMGNDLKNRMKKAEAQSTQTSPTDTDEKVEVNLKRKKETKKSSKVLKVQTTDVPTTDVTTLEIPTKFVKVVKKFVNLLCLKEEAKKLKLDIPKHFQESSESEFEPN